MTTRTFQPDAAAGKDTYVEATDSTWNFGISPTLRSRPVAPTCKVLIEFDLSSIPSGAKCNSAILYVRHGVVGAAQAWTATVYSIAVGNAAWIEGTKNGVVAGVGEPCWDALAANGGGGVLTPWAGSAGLSTPGTDYEAAALGSFAGNRADAVGTEYSTALTALRVQGWFGVVNTNYGILIATAGNPMDSLCSSDHATALYRPKLVIDFTEAADVGIFTPDVAEVFGGIF